MNLERLATDSQGTSKPVLSSNRQLSGPAKQIGARLSFRNIGAVYVWILLVIVFSFWASDTFLQWDTVRQVLNQNAITALVALSLVIPLSAGMFDLSIGYALGLCNVVCAYLIVRAEFSVGAAIGLTLLTACVIGLLNATIVVQFKIDSVIATLATGSLLLAGITLTSGQSEIVSSKLTTGVFADIANAEVGGISLAVVYMLIVAVAIWFVLEHTVAGRWFYATGFNSDAARLAGIPVRRLQFISLVVSAVIAGGIAGIAVTSQIGSGSTTVGPPFLLNAFAAAFLGATQLRAGRFNAWGTVIAVFMLGTGTAGLGLAGAPVWAPAVFVGVVLLLALGVTRAERHAASE